MNKVTERVIEALCSSRLSFIEKPLIIGGMAMEYYGLRKSGADIDLVICEKAGGIIWGGNYFQD